MAEPRKVQLTPNQARMIAGISQECNRMQAEIEKLTALAGVMQANARTLNETRGNMIVCIALDSNLTPEEAKGSASIVSEPDGDYLVIADIPQPVEMTRIREAS